MSTVIVENGPFEDFSRSMIVDHVLDRTYLSRLLNLEKVLLYKVNYHAVNRWVHHEEKHEASAETVGRYTSRQPSRSRSTSSRPVGILTYGQV